MSGPVILLTSASLIIALDPSAPTVESSVITGLIDTMCGLDVADILECEEHISALIAGIPGMDLDPIATHRAEFYRRAMHSVREIREEFALLQRLEQEHQS